MDVKDKKIHFIGIGGIGISAMARMCMSKGSTVSGSDRSESEITIALQNEGMTISIGADAKNIPENTDMVIYTIAISKDNPELIEAQNRKIEIKTYPEMLGVMTSGHRTIAVSGTHGKTTTTAMTAKVLESSGLDPYMIVGSLVKETTDGVEHYTNYREGKSDLFVIEACEYRRSFLNVNPFVLVITNIEEDHLDYYKDLSDIEDAFRELAQKVPADGAIVCDPNNGSVAKVIKGLPAKIIDYTNVDIVKDDLRVPGEHNRKDARCAYRVAEFFGASENDIKKGLLEFKGTWRRFEYIGELSTGAIVHDDYAHHPTEILATLLGARELYPNHRIVIAFHPHEYSRTKLLFNDFVDSLSKVDQVVIAPIFAARESFDPSISSSILADEIKKNGGNAVAIDDFKDIENFLFEKTKKGDIIITMGAGDIYKVAEALKNR